MALAMNSKVFGLRDVKVKGKSVAAVDLPASRTLSFTEIFASDQLRGDDQVVAVVSQASHIEWELESGGLDPAAWAELTGRTVTAGGSGAVETNTITADGAEDMPWLIIWGRSVGDAGDDIHVKILRAKLTQLEGGWSEGEFFLTKASGIGIDDGTTGIYQIIQNETTTVLT